MLSLQTFVRNVLVEGNISQRWGVGGSGIIFVCPREQKVFLQQRTYRANNGGGQWAFPGGGIHPGDGPEKYWALPIEKDLQLANDSPLFYQQALSEAGEECGSIPKHQIVDTYLYQDRGFKYRTFIAKVTAETKQNWNINPDPEHAWESIDMGWFPIKDFLKMDLFFGFTPQLIAKTKNAMALR